MSNTCISCGAAIPDGRRVCSNCEYSYMKPDAILEDGTPLYLKTSTKPDEHNFQLFLYKLVNEQYLRR